MNITLYDYWRSSAAYRLRIAFGLAGLSYTSVSIDLVAGEQRGSDNLSRNPQGLVPSVEFDGTVFTQSLAIIEYLDDAGFHSFLPRDLHGRMSVRALSYAIAMEIHPVCNLGVAKFASENSGGNLDMKAWMHAFIPERLAAFDAMMDPKGTYCWGDRITMADLCLIPQMYNAERWGVDVSGMKNIQRVMGALNNLEAVQNAHPELVPR